VKLLKYCIWVECLIGKLAWCTSSKFWHIWRRNIQYFAGVVSKI